MKVEYFCVDKPESHFLVQGKCKCSFSLNNSLEEELELFLVNLDTKYIKTPLSSKEVISVHICNNSYDESVFSWSFFSKDKAKVKFLVQVPINIEKDIRESEKIRKISRIPDDGGSKEFIIKETSMSKYLGLSFRSTKKLNKSKVSQL